jgi:hypothetical protein
MSSLIRNTYYLIGKDAEAEARQLIESCKNMKGEISIVKSCPWCVKIRQEGSDISLKVPGIKGLICVSISDQESSEGQVLLGVSHSGRGSVKMVRKHEYFATENG